MERAAGIVRLYHTAQKLARELGVEIEESLTGGGSRGRLTPPPRTPPPPAPPARRSDGNVTAALGIPTLDGLGAVGEGAHAANESTLVARISDRTALIAKLLTA